MREALRSTFGYGGLVDVPPETLAAATAAAGDAAVEEGSRALLLNSSGSVGGGGGVRSVSPTQRYLDYLSPPSEEDEENWRWLGAEAAADAAGAAAGAVMGAAGQAAGVAAEVAAAAVSGTIKVAAPVLGAATKKEENEGDEDGGGGGGGERWQFAGGRTWRRDGHRDDREFGEGPLGVRPKRVDPEKAMDMELSPALSSTTLKVWGWLVGVCNE